MTFTGATQTVFFDGSLLKNLIRYRSKYQHKRAKFRERDGKNSAAFEQ